MLGIFDIFYVESYVEMTTTRKRTQAMHLCSYLRQVLGNATIKVHRGHHVLSSASSIDIIHCSLVVVVVDDKIDRVCYSLQTAWVKSGCCACLLWHRPVQTLLLFVSRRSREEETRNGIQDLWKDVS